MSEDTADTLVLRTPTWAAVLRVLPVEALITASFLTSYLLTRDSSALIPLCAAPLAVLLAVPLARRFRVELGPHELRAIGWTTRTIPWSRVQGVQPATGIWFPRPVTVYDGSAAVRLPLVNSMFSWDRKRAEQQYHQIGQWWLAHRGQDWGPTPPPAPNVDARTDPYAPPAT